MPRVCTICSHPNKADIDKALLSGESFRNLSERFGTSTSALFRHKQEHLPVSMIKAQQVQEMTYGESLVGEMQNLIARTEGILREAERVGDLRLALDAIKQSRANLEMMAKLAIVQQRSEVLPAEPTLEQVVRAVDKELRPRRR